MSDTDLVFDTLHGDVCDAPERCNCGYGVNALKTSWTNDLAQCHIFEFDYVCPLGADCVVDCMALWPFDNGCYDKAISAGNTIQSCSFVS